MKDNILKKQFTKKDIQRIRNLVKVNLENVHPKVLDTLKKPQVNIKKVIYGKKEDALGL